jgi:hypothetical protein
MGDDYLLPDSIRLRVYGYKTDQNKVNPGQHTEEM